MKTAIIYYGYGIHTQMITEMIQEKIDADIYRIQPETEYSEEYQKVVDETEDNLQTKKTPPIKKLNLNLDDYELLIIGTPVWWYTIAPPLRTFLKQNDLTDKKVVFFATNAGWLGSTFKEFRQQCNADIKIEKSIKFTTDYSENKLVTTKEEINEWIEEIMKI